MHKTVNIITDLMEQTQMCFDRLECMNAPLRAEIVCILFYGALYERDFLLRERSSNPELLIRIILH